MLSCCRFVYKTWDFDANSAKDQNLGFKADLLLRLTYQGQYSRFRRSHHTCHTRLLDSTAPPNQSQSCQRGHHTRTSLASTVNCCPSTRPLRRLTRPDRESHSRPCLPHRPLVGFGNPQVPCPCWCIQRRLPRYTQWPGHSLSREKTFYKHSGGK